MGAVTRVLILVGCFTLASFTDPEACVIELDCAECVPDNMPLVTSHAAGADGAVRAAPGDAVVLSCGGGRFVQYPLRDTVAATCEAGRYRVRHDQALLHLLQLGCQENIFEDVLHHVEDCGAPLQGRAYRQRAAGAGPVRHVATLCFDADRAVTVRALLTNAPHNALRLPPHAESAAPLSLLGNFNQMFDARTRLDAERLYSDEARLNRRVRELLKHERVALAEQTLTSAPLLAPDYFEEQSSRCAEFASNRLAVWRSVARGNLRHAQRDVARLLRRARSLGLELRVHAGTHGVLALRTGPGGEGEAGRTELYLKPGRFPVPRYVWMVVQEADARAVALVVLNDPFVCVSEVRAAVFCESVCGRVPWLMELQRHRRYETPLYGLTFCCELRDFAATVTSLPRHLLANLTNGNMGLLADYPPAPGN